LNIPSDPPSWRSEPLWAHMSYSYSSNIDSGENVRLNIFVYIFSSC